MPAAIARYIVLGMAVLAIVVQIGVWGATKLHTNGALLESWRPYFGWPYGLLFAAVQAGLCWRLAIDRGIVCLARTWGITGAALLVLWFIIGKSELTVDSGVALTAGMGALVLAAGLLEGQLVLGAPRRVARIEN
ncbi:hypothetical protein BH20ACT14_BH20ACT14_12830 [soil metagenome]